MATVTINVEMVEVPHTWITLTDDSGVSQSYGFGPFGEYRPYDPHGFVRLGDDAGNVNERIANGWQKSYEVSPEQYQAMESYTQGRFANPGAYAGVGRNCTDFVREVLKEGGCRIRWGGSHFRKVLFLLEIESNLFQAVLQM